MCLQGLGQLHFQSQWEIYFLLDYLRVGIHLSLRMQKRVKLSEKVQVCRKRMEMKRKMMIHSLISKTKVRQEQWIKAREPHLQIHEERNFIELLMLTIKVS